MGDIFTPGNMIVLVIVLAGLAIGGKRIVGSLRGQSCCTDAAGAPKVKKVKVEDTDEANYPYTAQLPIGGMSCEGCVQNVANALNGVTGTWATVSLAQNEALIHSKNPIDLDVYKQAVKAAGYFVPHL